MTNLKWKTGLVLCMINGTKISCFNEKLFYTEVKKLRSLFHSNRYSPPHTIQNDDVLVNEKLILFDLIDFMKTYLG